MGQLNNHKLFSWFTVFVILASIIALSEYSRNAAAEEGDEDPLAEAGLSLIALK